MFNEEPKYIIAIGASAGGLEEINTFFEHTPLDGVAYVIVQHLSRDFKSRMVELLSKHSKLAVREATQSMPVCTNVVYLIPSDKFMTIKDGKLQLTDKPDIKGLHLTINTFFNSLAADNGKKAIGIVMSGHGSDGSEGIKAIKEAGGMIMARNPETSEFSSMPAHAIATDTVDYILEPASMPGAIEAYVKDNDSIMAGTIADGKSIAVIIDYIKEKLPFDFSDYKLSTIIRRTKKRAAEVNVYTLEEYLAVLKNDPEELKALAKDFLISVTAFFRDPEAFELMEEKVFSKILETLAPKEEIKIWVAGCATGEEAYSLAISLSELLAQKSIDATVKIFATDIDTAALIYAGKGVYSADRVKNVDAQRIKKYFTKEGDCYTIRPHIRKMLIFAQHDLVKNPPYCNMHLISCRNLLIYMTPILQKKVFDMLLFGLKTNGYLFLGSSENPLSIIENLEVIDKKWKIYKNLKNKRSVSLDTFTLPEMLEVNKSFVTLRDSAEKILDHTFTETISAMVAEEMDCFVVCVDSENTVVKSFGDTSKYLLQQNFNTNLVELLPRALAVAYNTLSREALKSGGRASVKDILIKHNKEVMRVSLTVSPILLNNKQQKGLIVIFNDQHWADNTKPEEQAFDEITYNSSYTKKLEEELKDIKAELRITYEKLDASNENMQSFNEELISANEEMQSTNEEMQSVNEELHTINADYQMKNKELVEINDDLNNYFRSNINGQLFVNNDLELMKFSPGAVKHINLLETDIGRPINHISTNIKLDTIVEDTREVIEKGIILNKEIETTNGKWYQVMIMPYLLSNKKSNGAIITFNDISELKATQHELSRKNQSLQRINSDLDHFVHAASHDLLEPLGNIESSIGMLNDIKVGDKNFSDFLFIINSSIKTFRTLVTDIATIARVENDMLVTERVNFNEIITNIEWSLQDKIALSGAKITRKLDVEEISFSKKNLRGILFNLISNAVKFRSEKPPVISVTTYMEDGCCVIAVEDNGIGISPKELKKIFYMYGRLRQDIQGSGIGLYLAKKIIDASDGTIEVESEPGVGTKFTIFLKEQILQPT